MYIYDQTKSLFISIAKYFAMYLSTSLKEGNVTYAIKYHDCVLNTKRDIGDDDSVLAKYSSEAAARTVFSHAIFLIHSPKVNITCIDFPEDDEKAIESWVDAINNLIKQNSPVVHDQIMETPSQYIDDFFERHDITL